MLTKNTAALPALMKAGPADGLSEGEFVVYPSTFIRTPDAVGDVVAKGAFLKSIDEWKSSGNVLPGLFGHRMDDPMFYIASAKDMGEDDHGFWVKGEFDLDLERGRHTYKLVKGRRLNELSFAYDTIDEAAVTLDGGVKANELREVRIHEFSFVPRGANPDTSVVAVKAMCEAVAAEIKAGRVLSAKNEGELRAAQSQLGDAHEALGRVLSALDGTSDEEKASDTGQERPPSNAASDSEREPARKSSVDPSALLNAITASLDVEFAA